MWWARDDGAFFFGGMKSRDLAPTLIPRIVVADGGAGASRKRIALDRCGRKRDDGLMRKLAYLLILGCIACSTSAQPPGPARPAPAAPAAGQGATLPPTLAQLHALVGTAACTNSSQCHSVPIGARACGGPESYLAWSSANTDGAAVRALAERYQAERKAQLAASGVASDCRFMADPGAVCQAGTCRLGTGGGPPAA
jgi:hypothetical protein